MGPRPADLAAAYRLAGEAAAAAAAVAPSAAAPVDPTAGAFFDVDNTVMRGASIFHLARGLAARDFFTMREIAEFAVKQVRFVLSGSEDLDDMAEATELALGFVKGKRVDDVVRLGEEIFDELMVDKLWPGTLALAQNHLDAGQRVWLVTATPVELAAIIASRLGLTGALGTVSEVETACTPGGSSASPCTGPRRRRPWSPWPPGRGWTSTRCAAYSDSANDIPMLSVGRRPVRGQPRPHAAGARPGGGLADQGLPPQAHGGAARRPRRRLRRGGPRRRRRHRRRHRPPPHPAPALPLKGPLAPPSGADAPHAGQKKTPRRATSSR